MSKIIKKLKWEIICEHSDQYESVKNFEKKMKNNHYFQEIEFQTKIALNHDFYKFKFYAAFRYVLYQKLQNSPSEKVNFDLVAQSIDVDSLES